MNLSETNSYELTAVSAPSSGETPSTMVPDAAQLTEDDEVVQWGDHYSFEGYQVVRGEFFAHIREPSATFNRNKVYVNMACLSKFPNTSHVILAVNPETKVLLISPSRETIRNAQVWCRTNKDQKRVPREMTCPIFFKLVFDMMKWDENSRYKFLGQLVQANGVTSMAFDLNSPEVYKRTYDEEGNSTVSRSPVFPESWNATFGPTVEEHRQNMQLSFFGDYVVCAVERPSKSPKKASPTPSPDQAESIPPAEETGGVENVSEQ